MLARPKYFQQYTRPSTPKWVYGSQWHVEPPYPAMIAGLPSYFSAYCLFFAKQSVEKIILSVQPGTLYTGHLPSLPFLIHSTSLQDGRRELYGNTKPAVHLPLFRAFSDMLARLIMWEHTHANKNERQQALPSELDRSRGKGKGKK